MGSTPKSLERLMQLTEKGLLAPGAEICDLGATQIFGDHVNDGARSFLSYYAGKSAKARAPSDLSKAELAALTHGCFLGDLLVMAGFGYTALDIFHATRTILFDLNAHEPGPEIAGKFDLVMNFGTTEHVLNQWLSFRTIHLLPEVGGLMYHDLPMAGYIHHAFFRYDPMFFDQIAQANGYELIGQYISGGSFRDTPRKLLEQGYPHPTFEDMGIEAIFRKPDTEPFRVPLETSTSLSVDPKFWNIAESGAVKLAGSAEIYYPAGHTGADTPIPALARQLLSRIKSAVGRRISGT
jgi:hypothetical protein